VAPINNKIIYLFTVRRAHVQVDIPFTKTFNIFSHPHLLSFAQYLIEDDLRPLIVFHLINFLRYLMMCTIAIDSIGATPISLSMIS
jgi:hypothetical protein